ncbi:sulfatase [Paenibacillus allorhizosphaerae]|uniref:Ulvan-active sulfatase n=1 Tax=Paenibacillus allorhizosphaerae TaxID=2849866 RepID=A0ABN7TJD9_9BACL|nr:sulfatase [Paenibacillus allorhizosphaerae]CAG7637538.1 Ulvan-active sulfatase [Paenibacillus allorhizosphaerae]
MNIVYIHTHDTGRYIEPYGYLVPTPRLQQFAEEGILFRQAYNAGPTCSPSRSALLTGMVPHSNGMIGLAHRGFRLHDPGQHLAAFLKNRGFETVLSGVQHEGKQPEALGYDRVLHSPGGSKKDGAWDEENAKRAAEYIRGCSPDRPFFLAFGMFSTHREFPDLDGSVNPNYVQPPHPLPDTKQNREDTAAFISSARIADRCAGIVLDALKETGLERDTLIIYTTDHGIAFPRMKCNLFDTGIGVSLILKVPGHPANGRVIDSLVSHIDLFPTICDLLSLERPSWLQGTSLLPLLSGEAEKVRDEIFSEVTFHAAYEPMRCIRTERYKFIRLYDDHDGHVPANIDDGLSKTFLLDSGLLEEKRDREMLFDLHLDPVERVNLVNDPRYKAVFSDLSARLQSWMEQTSDPLLHGKVPVPEGAKVNRRDAISPKLNEFE